MKLAPIILFVYNRPWHTEQTLNALRENNLADQSTLYIFSDGIKINSSNEVKENVRRTREIIKQQKWCKEVIILEKTENDGLANSIVNGVTEIVNKYGKVIVLEDDIVTSNGFLKYMNDALDFYESNEKIFHISGYMYPHKQQLPDTFFLNVPLCWGWATWKRSWKYFNPNTDELIEYLDQNSKWINLNIFGKTYLGDQLKANKTGLLNTWFIKWHASVFIQNGFTLYPGKSLVNNIGFDNTGVHNGKTEKFSHNKLQNSITIGLIGIIENQTANDIVVNFYHQQDFPVIQQVHLLLPGES